LSKVPVGERLVVFAYLAWSSHTDVSLWALEATARGIDTNIAKQEGRGGEESGWTCYQ